MKGNDYKYIIVESVQCQFDGQHGDVHVRPLPGQEPFTPYMFVECPSSMKQDYPIGTKFRIKAKLVKRDGKASFVYTHYTWPFEVLND